jgi:hypothetical protein
LTFLKEAEGALVPVDSPAPAALTEGAAAISDGRELSFPLPATAVQIVQPMAVSRAVLTERARNDKR